MNNVMNIREIIYILKKQIRLLILVPIIFAVVGFLISSFLISSIYEAKSELLVNQTNTSEGAIGSTDVDMNLSLLDTYRAIIESARVRELVYEALDKKFSKEALENSLEIETHSQNQIISIKVRESDPKSASQIANTYAEVSQEEIIELMNLENVKVMTVADVEAIQEPVYPKPLINTFVAFFIGLLLAIIYVALSAYFNTKLLSDYDVKKYLNLPVIGNVGMLTKDESRFRSGLYANNMTELSNFSNLNQAVKEAFRLLRINIYFQESTKKIKTILVTSSEKAEGKTTITGNLAIAIANDNKKTLIINADLRKPDWFKLDEKDESKGLSTYLSGHSNLDMIIKDSSIPNLYMISNGPLPPNPTELLSSPRMDEFLREVEERFDIVLFDSTPMIFSDPLVIASKVDGSIFVSEVNKTKVSTAQKAINQLKMADATVLGVVLNNKEEKVKEDDYYYG